MMKFLRRSEIKKRDKVHDIDDKWSIEAIKFNAEATSLLVNTGSEEITEIISSCLNVCSIKLDLLGSVGSINHVLELIAGAFELRQKYREREAGLLLERDGD